MVTTEQLLALARQGADAWNKWRHENPEEVVDFSGVDFTQDENCQLSFSEFEFGNRTQFKKAIFGNLAKFAHTTFGDLTNFSGATFGNSALFEGATFGNSANFAFAMFGNNSRFSGVAFRERSNFDGASFGNSASFISVTFGDRTDFRGAKFGHHARFAHSTFGASARFTGTTFGHQASFKLASFLGPVLFNARVEGKVPDFQHLHGEAGPLTDGIEAVTSFHSITFSEARFCGKASFEDRSFVGKADFSFAQFDAPPDFRATQHRENLDWTGVRFSFGNTPFRGWTTDSEIVTRLRRLRGIAAEIHAVDAERDLFILERQAERGVLWSEWWRGGWHARRLNWWRGEWHAWWRPLVLPPPWLLSGWRARLTGWWRPLAATLLMFLYRWSSDCGRSVVLALAWLVAANVGFYVLYARLYVSLIGRPLDDVAEKALQDVTIASAVPFGATAKPAFEAAVKLLFKLDATDIVDIPWQIQAATAGQGIVNLILVFLLGLALRNHFKVK